MRSYAENRSKAEQWCERKGYFGMYAKLAVEAYVAALEELGNYCTCIDCNCEDCDQ